MITAFLWVESGNRPTPHPKRVMTTAGKLRFGKTFLPVVFVHLLQAAPIRSAELLTCSGVHLRSSPIRHRFVLLYQLDTREQERYDNDVVPWKAGAGDARGAAIARTRPL